MAIFFDLDDTLIDDRAAQEAYLSHLFTTYQASLPWDAAGFRAAWRQAGERHYGHYLRGDVSLKDLRRTLVRHVFQQPDMTDDKTDEVIDEYVAVYEASWRLFPDVLPTLEVLRGLTLGIITNGNEAQQIKKLERTGLLGRFAVVVISEAVGHAKPDPEIFWHAMSRMGCSPSECVFIGDDWNRDVQGAIQSGIHPIWLTRPRVGATMAKVATGVVNIQSLAELVERPNLRAMLGLDAR